MYADLMYVTEAMLFALGVATMVFSIMWAWDYHGYRIDRFVPPGVIALTIMVLTVTGAFSSRTAAEVALSEHAVAAGEGYLQQTLTAVGIVMTGAFGGMIAFWRAVLLPRMRSITKISNPT